MIPRDPYQVRLSGRGGQGLILAGLLLAEAGTGDGLHVVQTQSYGPEARLGASKSDVVLSRNEIAFPGVVAPDLLLCLSREAYLKYGARAAEGGIRIVEATVAREVEVEGALLLPIVETARDIGNVLVANVVALGALIALSDAVSETGLRDAIRVRVKPQFLEWNERALEAGMRLGAQAR